MIILLFGGVGRSTLEVEIYKAARGTLDFSEVGRLAIFETFLAAIFTAFYARLEKKSAQTRGISFYQRNSSEKIQNFSERFFSIIIFSTILIFFIAPIFSIFYNGFSSAKEIFTFSSFARVFKMRGFLPSLRTTILTATATSIFCVIIAFFYAAFLRSVDSRGKILILRLLPMIPMCVSSVVTGVLIIILVRHGSPIHLIFAQVFLIWPLAFRQIYAVLSKIPEETVDAGRILSKKPLELIFRIFLPESKRGILSAFGFCFAASAGDTTLPLVLALPKFDTLSLFTYRLAGSYRFHEACAAGMILGILCAAIFAWANRLKVRN